MTRSFLPFLFCCAFLGLRAQENPYEAVDERLLVESRWRYTYTLHLESNTVIHQAGEAYRFFLYFRYDNSFQQYLNGGFSRGSWRLEGRTLHYPFRMVDRFEITALNRKMLVLEFHQPNSKGTFQYHFVRVDAQEAPFVKPRNELPDVIVEAEKPRREERIAARKERRRLRRAARHNPPPKPTYINVELTGGGFFGGIDPVFKDFIHIKSNGRLIKEFHSLYNGLLVTKKDIPREELEQFAEWVVQQNFFEFERLYDCTDPACQKRKFMKPKPIPLRLSITYGRRKKVVTVTIWGKDERGIQYVDYPPALANIVDAIQRMANRIESPLVRK